jgi:hypothetical protein
MTATMAIRLMLGHAVFDAIRPHHADPVDFTRTLLLNHMRDNVVHPNIPANPFFRNLFLTSPLWRERAFQALSYEIQVSSLISTIACSRFLAIHSRTP